MDFIKDIADKYTCEYCVIGRQKAIPYISPTTPGTRPSEFIYSDLVEPLSPTSFNGYRYFITFKNDFIFYSKVYCIRYKSKTFAIFLRFKARLKSYSYKISHIRLDNGGEYISKAFLNYLALSGIKQKPIVPDNPQINNAIERFRQTLLYKIHSILLSFNLNKSF